MKSWLLRRGKRRVVVLGREIAAAQRAERERVEAGTSGPSPMPRATYDKWRGEYRLTNPVRLPLDGAISEFCREFRRMGDDARNEARRSISLGEFYTLLTFGKRAAVFALRGSRQALLDGLTAVATLEAKRVDYRDILWGLGLLHHAAGRVGQDPRIVFADAAALGEAEVAKLIDGCPMKPVSSRRLRDDWGHVEVETEGGVGLIRWGFGRYVPTHDLTSTVMKIAALVEQDEYQPEDPEIATAIPEAWLDGAVDRSVGKALRAIRATAMVDAQRRPEVIGRYADQNLWVWLAELPDETLASNLANIAERPATGFVRMGLAEGRLFALTVARSIAEGVPSHETAASLRRFAPLITDALRAASSDP